jgi:hypothetical protein
MNQNKTNLMELINNCHSFPEEIKKEFYELVTRHQYIVKQLQLVQWPGTMISFPWSLVTITEVSSFFIIILAMG